MVVIANPDQLGPFVPHFLGVDVLSEKMPNWTPYRYSFNNPLKYIDPNGGFEIPIHKAITEEAAAKRNLSAEQTTALRRGAQNADYFGFAQDWHFDGRKNFEEVQNTWKTIQSRIESRGKDDYYHLGFDLHNVQDFYAHSNYVDLYVQYYKDNGGDMSKFSADMIPLFEEGIQIQDFKEGYLEPQLRTGDFQLLNNEKMPWTNKEKLEPTTHYNFNKDSNESKRGGEKINETITYHDAARNTATRASVKILDQKKSSNE